MCRAWAIGNRNLVAGPYSNAGLRPVYMVGCLYDDGLFGRPKSQIERPIFGGDPRRDHSFDNLPYTEEYKVVEQPEWQ